eukprot:scaffold145476_cov154-Phaeocystis_antarctica.AAC.1
MRLPSVPPSVQLPSAHLNPVTVPVESMHSKSHLAEHVASTGSVSRAAGRRARKFGGLPGWNGGRSPQLVRMVGAVGCGVARLRTHDAGASVGAEEAGRRRVLGVHLAGGKRVVAVRVGVG